MLYYVRAHPEFGRRNSRRGPQALARGERKADQLLPLCSPQTLELLASFQRAVVSELVGRTLDSAEERGRQCPSSSLGVLPPIRRVARDFRAGSRPERVEGFFPSRELSTDNAAMIAAAAYPKCWQAICGRHFECGTGPAACAERKPWKSEREQVDARTLLMQLAVHVLRGHLWHLTDPTKLQP